MYRRVCAARGEQHEANKLTSSPADIELCRQQSFTLLYRLLFVLFAEDRKLLPYKIDRAYTDNRSLGRFRDEIAKTLDRLDQGKDVEFPEKQVQYWPDLLSLFDLIDAGAARYRVPAYNGGLFDSEQHPFLRDKVLPDGYLARVIDRLSRAPDPKHPDRGLFRVDYRDLAIQHLGNVYEGLLEVRPKIAESDLVVIRTTSERDDEEKYLRAGEPLPKGYEATGQRYEKGSVYLVTDKGERRASGSYYTPDHIVGYIVEQTLGPICEGIDRQLIGEIEQIEQELKRARGENRAQLVTRIDTLKCDFDDRLLRWRVLDPAMGSGHFLIRACQYLAEQIATNPHAKEDSQAGDEEESTLVYWKRRVAESCLYGVDLNSMAVELAKLALWLETVSVNQPLTFLDHHLRHGNSLVGTSVESLGVLPGTELVSNRFEQQVKQRLPRLLDALAMIRRTPSDTVEHVKEKDKLFRRTFEPVRQPFLLSAHA
jgi:type I restriction-modification system DNA methylase subunit